MSRYRSDPEMPGELSKKPNACSRFLHYTWKTITCLFSHVTLVSMVVSYCVLGAYTFAYLEVDNEKDVKKNISKIRLNVTDELWKLATEEFDVLEETNFTEAVIMRLKDFEAALVKAVTKDGWDGKEETEIVQWTVTGALFYSIIVITTIGYGHIAPKTKMGKIVTIFYAILGIPLMLLCLSNIGDIMATSFRFLYWRVCCYVCTKKPKRPKRRDGRGTVRLPEGRFANRSRSFRRSARTSTRSADSGFGFSEMAPSSHSDTELRYTDEIRMPQRGRSLPRMRPSQISRYSDSTVPSGVRDIQVPTKLPARGGSLDRRKKDFEIQLDPMLLSKTPILCNKYVVNQGELIGNHIPGITTREMEGRRLTPPMNRRAQSMPRTQNYLEPPREPSPSDSRDDLDSLKKSGKRKLAHHNTSPKMMTPLGYGHRSKYLDDPESDDDYYDDGYYDSSRQRIKPVPIWLCVFLVVSYIMAGAFLFHAWEDWSFLDATYFCFITLTTIGFGDLVPAKGVSNNDDYATTVSIAFCSLYLLFGIALLAMSFNLVQEEVIANVKSVARTLGIIKSEDDDSDEDE